MDTKLILSDKMVASIFILIHRLMDGLLGAIL